MRKSLSPKCAHFDGMCVGGANQTENQAKKRLAPPVMYRAGPDDLVPHAPTASDVRDPVFAGFSLGAKLPATMRISVESCDAVQAAPKGLQPDSFGWPGGFNFVTSFACQPKFALAVADGQITNKVKPTAASGV
jgi:hypothetical protein